MNSLAQSSYDPAERRSERRRSLAASAAILALSFHAAGPAFAAEAGDIFADLTPLAANDMDRMRGGFKVGGYDINIGVTVRTAIDGVVEVTSNFSIDRPGALQNLSTQISEAAQTAVDAATDAAKIAVAVAAAATDQALADAKKQVADATASIPALKAAAPPPPSSPSAAADIPALPSPQPSATSATAPKMTVEVMTSVIKDTVDKITHTVAVQNAPSAVQNVPAPVGEAPAPQDPPTADVPQQTPAPATTLPPTIPVSIPDMAEIVHTNGSDGHLSVINNSLNNVSIRQSVDVDLAVQNFHQVQNLTSIQRSMTAIARHIGVLSLRH